MLAQQEPAGLGFLATPGREENCDVVPGRGCLVEGAELPESRQHEGSKKNASERKKTWVRGRNRGGEQRMGTRERKRVSRKRKKDSERGRAGRNVSVFRKRIPGCGCGMDANAFSRESQTESRGALLRVPCEAAAQAHCHLLGVGKQWLAPPTDLQRTKLLHQLGVSLYNTSHGFHEEEVKKTLLQFPGGSIDLQKKDNGIGILTLNNPSKMNAFSGVMMLQLLEKVIELENWKEGKGLIVRGAKNTFSSGSDLNAVKALGTPQASVMMLQLLEKVIELENWKEGKGLIVRGAKNTFSSGSDLNAVKALGTPQAMALSMFMQNTLTRFMRLPLISVALVQGRALGGGAEFTTACDFRLMTPESEIRFVHKEMGIIPSWGGASRLVEIIGSRQALKVLSGALKLNSEKALNIGMIEEVLQSSDETKSLEEAQEWLMQFVSGPPEVIRALKKSVCSGRELCLEEALQNERDLLGTVWGGPANLEAIARKVKFNK
ncbi:Ethylmalonyl-CoA decarboxylase [Sciurus carolinensis]|uniref:Ethylmalonyl-CoA decarboxylase n=1 Tax=Sciurus carolinensis TaxID=30640 RepID=A0AA41NJD2_SCICA|nr:Ethylmalonyl-CoA decarboxylase [Sciurus carolinensis]